MVIIRLEHFIDLKAGENSHQKPAELLSVVDENRNPVGRDVYSADRDLGAKARIPGWINIGDISACLRTSVGLGEVYKDTRTPHVVVASKHTRPVIIANGRTQLEAVIKAIAGDLNSPFGGIWGFNTPLELETAQFFNRPNMFFEGMVAPVYEVGTADILKNKHKNRFLMQTGNITPKDLDVFGFNLQPVSCGKFLSQPYDSRFDARKESVVVTGNNGNSDIDSLDLRLIDDITFAGNAAVYLSSNLVFFVHNGAIAGLGDGCGARTVAAEKARRMLEISAYAALTANRADLWQTVLFDTPFKREDFEGQIETPLRLTAFSDAFYPKLDGFVETAGLDRTNPDFQDRKVKYMEDDHEVTFIPKRKNYGVGYNPHLIPEVVVQPGGSLGDSVVSPIAERYNVKMVFTMTSDLYESYRKGEKVTGRRFFGHIIM